MIYVYAFAAGLRGLPDRRGVDDAPLAAESLHGLGVVFSRHTGPLAGAEAGNAIAHGLVVEDVAVRSDGVLPVRFGETFPDGGALEEAVRGRASQLHEALTRVRGCVELGVRVTSDAAGRSGRAYLEARLRETSTASLLDEVIAPYSRAAVTTPRGERVHLVDREEANDACAAIRVFSEERPDVTVTCSGPWPPYTFGGAVR